MAASVGNQRRRFVERYGVGTATSDPTMPGNDGVDDEWLNRVVEEDRKKWVQSSNGIEILDDGEGTYQDIGRSSNIDESGGEFTSRSQRESPCSIHCQRRPMVTPTARVRESEQLRAGSSPCQQAARE